MQLPYHFISGNAKGFCSTVQIKPMSSFVLDFCQQNLFGAQAGSTAYPVAFWLHAYHFWVCVLWNLSDQMEPVCLGHGILGALFFFLRPGFFLSKLVSSSASFILSVVCGKIRKWKNCKMWWKSHLQLSTFSARKEVWAERYSAIFFTLWQEDGSLPGKEVRWWSLFFYLRLKSSALQVGWCFSAWRSYRMQVAVSLVVPQPDGPGLSVWGWLWWYCLPMP